MFVGASVATSSGVVEEVGLSSADPYNNKNNNNSSSSLYKNTDILRCYNQYIKYRYCLTWSA